MLELGFKITLAYLLGSLVGSLVIGQLRGVDIRRLGSGNAGGTNALRTQGWLFALAVMIIDVGKAVIAVGYLPGLNLPLVRLDPTIDRQWLAVACAVAVVLGHVYPVWYEFRGGKGAATLLGAIGVLAPMALLPFAFVWLTCVMVSGYVGLATMLGTATVPLYALLAQRSNHALLTFSVLMTGFVLWTHRANIQRMRRGAESRARRLWLLRPR